MKVGTLPVEPATIRFGVDEPSVPLASTVTVPGAAVAAIFPKLRVVAVVPTTFVTEIGATTIASALVVAGADVGPD